MAIVSQRVPIDTLPTVDSSGFFKNLVSSVGDAVDSKVAGNLVSQSVRNAQQQPANGVAPVPATTQVINAAPNAPAAVQGQVAPGTPNDIQNQFISTVQQGGVKNPYALAAIAATGRAESSWDPSKVNAAWPDPSQSGQSGTAGGILSWRNERLANLRNFAASQGEDPSNISPATQAKFFLQEDPSLVQKLNAAQSPQEAANIMANAWKFAGYDKPGGEAARRQALAQNYYSQQFANQQPVQVASNDPSVGMTAPSSAPVTPTSQGDFDPSTVTPAQMQALLSGQPAQQPRPGYVDPQVVNVGNQQTQPAQPQQQTAPQPIQVQTPSGPQQISSAITPLNRQNVDPDLIRRLVENPATRAYGLGVAQQVLGTKPNANWDFVKLDDGTLARANKQTGAVETLGNFQSGKKELLSNGKGAFYDSTTGQWVIPPEGAAGQQNELFGSTIPYYDAQGNLRYRQLSKSGQGQDVDFGPGGVAAPVTRNVDTGTAIITQGPGGRPVGEPIQKDIAGEANQRATGAAIGKGVGDAQAAYSSMSSKLPGLEQVVTKLNDLADRATYTSTGQLIDLGRKELGAEPRDAAVARTDYISTVDNQVLPLLRETFGAAFTQKEGETLRATLGDPDKTPTEKKVVLRSFIDQKKRDIAALAKQAGVNVPTTTQPTNKTSTGVSWSVE